MILLSGKNTFVGLIKWANYYPPIISSKIPFRLPSFFIKNQVSLIHTLIEHGFNPEIAYGFINFDSNLTVVPAPPISSASVEMSLGIEPHNLLGKIFPMDFRPTPIQNNSITIRGNLTTDFINELLNPIASFLDSKRRYAWEPTPEYAIQLTTISHLPEYYDYAFVIETHVALPQRVTIRGEENSFVTFETTYYTPYSYWYFSRLQQVPTYDNTYYSPNVMTIRDVEIILPKGDWIEFLGFNYAFTLSISKEIAPVYTFPAVVETITQGASTPSYQFPLVEREWGSVAQSIKEGSVSISLDITSYIPSDANLILSADLFSSADIYLYSRRSFPIIIKLSPYHTIKANAQVTNISSSAAINELQRINARIVLTEPIEFQLG